MVNFEKVVRPGHSTQNLHLHGHQGIRAFAFIELMQGLALMAAHMMRYMVHVLNATFARLE